MLACILTALKCFQDIAFDFCFVIKVHRLQSKREFFKSPKILRKQLRKTLKKSDLERRAN